MGRKPHFNKKIKKQFTKKVFYIRIEIRKNNQFGRVPERLIGAVLKTVVRDERTVGSNPTSSFFKASSECLRLSQYKCNLLSALSITDGVIISGFWLKQGICNGKHGLICTARTIYLGNEAVRASFRGRKNQTTRTPN